MQRTLAQIIIDSILAKNPKTFNYGFEALPGQSPTTGKVGFYDFPMGLTDTKGNYFYIRYVRDADISEPEDRTTSCHEVLVSLDLRLVAWVRNAIPERLQEVLRHDLITTDFFSVLTPNERKQITKLYPIEITEEIINYERITQEETLQEKRKIAKEVVLFAIDFKLKWNYKPYAFPDLCLDRQICSVC